MSEQMATQRVSDQEVDATIKKLTLVGVVGNVVLVAFKLLAGIFGGSLAMITDAIHSLSDVLATVIAFVGSKIAMKEADSSHPYGHERFECLAALLLACVLFIAGVGIGYGGVEALISGSWQEANPSFLALAGAVVSIITKEAMFQYTMHHAKRIDSAAFRADAWHHRSDALSSIGAGIGIIAAMCGFAWADAVASLIICAFVFKVAYDVARSAVDNMLDVPCTPEQEQGIKMTLERVEGVQRIDRLRTRQFGNRIFVDAEIAVDGNMVLVDAHAIAHNAHDAVEKTYANVKHIMIHVNPE